MIRWRAAMRLLPLAAAVALVLATCGPKTLALPADPIDRAATCGVIAAVEARAATDDIKASLPFAAQGRIIHYALLAGAEGGSFSTARAAAVNDRMGALEPAIIKGKWQTLLPACRAAFPAAAVSDVRLPSDSLQARLGCDALGDFLVKTMGQQGSAYGNELLPYRHLGETLDRSAMIGALRQRAGRGLEAQQDERRRALAAIVQSGSPMAVMDRCIRRYG